MNKFVLIPQEEYIRFKDYLVNKKAIGENNETIKDNSLNQSGTLKSDNILNEIKDNRLSYQESNSTDILRDIKANPLSEQETADALPPPFFPMQKAVPSGFLTKNLQQTGNGEKDCWIAKWEKYIT